MKTLIISERAKRIANNLETVEQVASGVEIGTCDGGDCSGDLADGVTPECEDYDPAEDRCTRYDGIVQARLDARRN